MLVSWNRLIILKCFGLFYLAGITSDKQFVYSYHDTFVPPLGLRATRLNVSSFSRLGRWEAKPDAGRLDGILRQRWDPQPTAGFLPSSLLQIRIDKPVD